MEEITLEAIARVKQPGKFREVGFVPGVLYGDNIESTAVKFDEKALKKVLSDHGPNAKVWIKINNSKKFGFIKEVQRHPMVRTLAHIDVQIVSTDHEIKLQIPITFKGDDELKIRQLELHVHKADVAVLGKMALMPETIVVDVTQMELGDSITINNMDLDKQLKTEEDVVYGIIMNLRILPGIEEEEAVVVEATTTEDTK